MDDELREALANRELPLIESDHDHPDTRPVEQTHPLDTDK